MRKKIFLVASALLVLALLVIHLSAHPNDRPTVTVKMKPMAPPLAKGDCTSSPSGYLEWAKDGRIDLTDAELGNWVSEKLSHGYVVTLYPKTKYGIFADCDCPSSDKVSAPVDP